MPVYYYIPVIQYEPYYIYKTSHTTNLTTRPKLTIPIIDPRTLKDINVKDQQEIGIQVDLIKKNKKKSVRSQTEINIKVKFNAETQTLPEKKCVAVENSSATFYQKIDIGQFCNLSKGIYIEDIHILDHIFNFVFFFN